MDTKTFHGKIRASDLSAALVNRFNHGNLTANHTKSGDQYIVQVASRRDSRSGGQTSLGITIQQFEDGVTVNLGEQSWMGIAASLGTSLLAVVRNPFNLIGRLDDIAQDIENLNLDDQIWLVISEIANTMGASHQLSERLRRTICEYCDTPNQVGAPRCFACGAPQGGSQPILCSNCGYVAAQDDSECNNCGEKL